MAQKTHPNIFRLGKSKEWKNKYFEKKSEEFVTYNFKNLEIKNYIKNFLKQNGLLIQDIKINFYKSRIKIFIPYYNTSISSLMLNKKIKLKKYKFKKYK